MMGFESVPSVQNPVVLPTEPCELFEFLTIVSAITKINGTSTTEI